MSLDHHPGFDCGGTLWFQNLTEFPQGALGPIFPLLIAGLHFVNVQISFRRSSVGKDSGLFVLLAKYYKIYLDLMTVPILFITFYVPQISFRRSSVGKDSGLFVLLAKVTQQFLLACALILDHST
ncbi:unnamed protein product [Ilex paraguariensis]|uniref:Uncharacterized protein n=1 Tax=Ilex paraguariensis TaxID=185542 RepID=A0ABC8SMC7_9AQUA